MKVNPTTFLFECLSKEDYHELVRLEEKISKGVIEFEHPFIKEWTNVFLPEDHARILICSTILHIRLLQSLLYKSREVVEFFLKRRNIEGSNIKVY